MWAILGLLVGGALACAAIALPGVLVLQASAKLVTGSALDSDRVYVTTFVSALSMFLIAFVLGLVFSGSLKEEADEARTRELRNYDTWHWSGEPEARGLDAVLGWGSTEPVHVQLQIWSAALSVAAWVAILRVRHGVVLWRGMLVVIVSQVIWTAVLGAVWGVWVGIGALGRMSLW